MKRVNFRRHSGENALNPAFLQIFLEKNCYHWWGNTANAQDRIVFFEQLWFCLHLPWVDYKPLWLNWYFHMFKFYIVANKKKN